MAITRVLALVIGIASLHPSYSSAQEVLGCGTLKNAYGPFDYRDPEARSRMLPIVTEFHFTRDVEMLARGSSGTVIGDLNYTLRAFPNFPRALQALERYALEGGQFPDNSSVPSAECYFQRAIAFAPDDPVVHAIHGDYLFRRGKRSEARAEYEKALQLAPGSAEITYNAGLFFLDVGDLERAKQLAKIAYDGGYPLRGLRTRIAAAEARLATRRADPK